MCRVKLLLLIIILFSCSSKKKITIEDAVKMPDPFSIYIPDSLKHLIPILDSVIVRDQKYRYGMNLQPESEQVKMIKEMKVHSKEIKADQQKNLKIVDSILEKYGWLGPKQIGLRGEMTLFMVIQHADLSVQEKYLPLLKLALKDKKAMPSQYAMLNDRIELHNHRPQVYGTQVLLYNDGKSLLQPLLNPDSVDNWRKSIGMDSLKYYLKTWKIEWNVNEYKKELPELKKKFHIEG